MLFISHLTLTENLEVTNGRGNHTIELVLAYIKICWWVRKKKHPQSGKIK
jgi:hypothetical protein